MVNTDVLEERKNSFDLSLWDGECLREHVMTVKVRGVELPIWRVIENLLWVKDQDTDEFVHFRLRWAQKMLYKALLEQSLYGKPMRQDILKARQLGFSTLIAGIIFVCAAFRENTKCVVMADIEKHGSTIFDIYESFYQHLDDSLENADKIHEWELDNRGKIHPDSIKPKRLNSRFGQMMVFANGSRIEVVVSGNNSGRGSSYTIIHSSETAFQDNLKETNRSLFKTVSIKNRKSMIFIETTANGFNAYKEMWDRDSLGKGVFNALFVPWYKNPDYQYALPPSGLPELPAWMYAKRKQHPEITDEQMMWYWMRFSEDNDEDGMLQEYPWDPSDAFINSGKSTFDSKLLRRRIDEVSQRAVDRGYFHYSSVTSPDGTTISVSDIERRDDMSGYWNFYVMPEKGKHYVVICDPSKGMNYDNSCIQVMEQNTGRQCACFDEKASLDEVAYQIYCAGIFYNTALVSSENNTGPYILDMLLKMQYPKLYLDQSQLYENFNGSLTHRYGHNTNRGNRDTMIANFVSAFRANPEIISDLGTLQEMETFQMVMTTSGGERKYKAMANGANAHDDRVMAYVPFWTVRQQQDFDAQTAVQAKGDDPFSGMSAGEVSFILAERRRKSEKKNINTVQNRLFNW